MKLICRWPFFLYNFIFFFFISLYLSEIEGANDKKRVFSFFQLIVIDAWKKREGVSINSNILCRLAARNYAILQIKSNFELIIVKLLNIHCLKEYHLHFNAYFFFLLSFNVLITGNDFHTWIKSFVVCTWMYIYK